MPGGGDRKGGIRFQELVTNGPGKAVDSCLPMYPQIPRRHPADQEAELGAKLVAGPAAAEAVTHQTLTFLKSSPCAQMWRLSPRHTGQHPEQVLGQPQPSLPRSPRPRGNLLPANWTSPQRDSAVDSPRPFLEHFLFKSEQCKI